jgi:hypothetical protein
LSSSVSSSGERRRSSSSLSCRAVSSWSRHNTIN